MDLLERRQHLAAKQAANRPGVRRVDPKREPPLAAVGLGLLAPDTEQRPHDAVLAPHLDAARRRRSSRAGRGSSRPGRRACAPSRGGAPGPGRRTGGRAARPRSSRHRAPADDLGAELARAERGVRVGLGPAEPVGDVERRDAVAELAAGRAWRHVESAPPETRHSTAPPGSISSCRRMCASTRSSDPRVSRPPRAVRRLRTEDAAVVEDVPHADRLVEADRGLVLAADEQRHGRRALEQQPDQVAQRARRVPPAAGRRVDPHLLQLHGARRPGRGLGLEQDDAVLDPRPRALLVDLRRRPPAKAVVAARQRVDARARARARRRRRARARRGRPGARPAGRCRRPAAARRSRRRAGPGRSSRAGGSTSRAASHSSPTATASPMIIRAFERAAALRYEATRLARRHEVRPDVAQRRERAVRALRSRRTGRAHGARRPPGRRARPARANRTRAPAPASAR